jgi:peptidyl-prolyl cis-trans isomerase B (cyclophilin B)
MWNQIQAQPGSGDCVRPKFAAVVVLGFACALSSCGSTAKPKYVNDAISDALRQRIARNELLRDDGVKDLQSMLAPCTTGDSCLRPNERWLAIRALGRIGSPDAVAILQNELRSSDPHRVAQAASAIGIAGALESFSEDELHGITRELSAALTKAGDQMSPLLEAMGRIGTQNTQWALAKAIGSPDETVATTGALALGRHGRRNIELTVEAQSALEDGASDARLAVRRASLWSLSRAVLAKGDVDSEVQKRLSASAKACATQLREPDPEARAFAVTCLAKRQKWVPLDGSIDAMIFDADWRVAVEAARALTSTDVAAERRDALAVALTVNALDRAPQRAHIHALMVALTQLSAQASRPAIAHMYGSLQNPPLSVTDTVAAHIQCLAIVGVWRAQYSVPNPLAMNKRMPLTVTELETCGGTTMNAGDRAALLAEILAVGPAAEMKKLADKLATSADDAVKSALMPAVDGKMLPWQVLVDAVATGSSLVAGVAAEAIAEQLAAKPSAPGAATSSAPEASNIDDKTRVSMESVLVARLQRETDIELAGTLMVTITKIKANGGATACESAVPHAALAVARSKCVKAFGITDAKSKKAPITQRVFNLPEQVAQNPDVRGFDWQIKTNKGEFTIRIDGSLAPWHAAVIRHLTNKGFYTGLRFHRVVENFVVQGGDPTGTGSGGPGFTVPAEPGSIVDQDSAFSEGAVGFADAGKDSGGSQWFVMHSHAAHLEGRYTRVGKVIAGNEVFQALVVNDRIVSAEIMAR